MITYKENGSSILYDLLFIGFVLLLEPWMVRHLTIDPTASASATTGWIYLSVVAAQSLGTICRMRWANWFLQTHRGASGSGVFVGAIFLLVMHLTLYGFMMSVDGIKNITGENYENTWGRFPLLIVLILLGLLPTTLVVMASFPSSKKTDFPGGTKYLVTDLIGCLLLLYSSTVVTVVFWSSLIGPLAAELHGTSVIGNLLITILFLFVFLLLYLPGRYIFLISDYPFRATWIRIFLVYLPFGYAVMSGKS